MADIDNVNSVNNNIVNDHRSVESAAGNLILAATDPKSGTIDTRQLASDVAGAKDFQTASHAYQQIEAELSRQDPKLAAQFSRDVTDAYAGSSPAQSGKGTTTDPTTQRSVSAAEAGSHATPQGLKQLLESRGIAASQNISSAAVTHGSSTSDTGAPATASAKSGATGVNYGSIPEEHHWRYDRYLSRTTQPLAPDAWLKKAQTGWVNSQSGPTFENEVREILGGPLGRGSKPDIVDGATAGSKQRRPDLPVRGHVTDIKNQIEIDNDPQLRAFAKHATDNKVPFNLIVSPRTQRISAPVLDNIRATKGSVTQFDPVTKKFSKIDIGQSGNWTRPKSLPTAATANQGTTSAAAKSPSTTPIAREGTTSAAPKSASTASIDHEGTTAAAPKSASTAPIVREGTTSTAPKSASTAPIVREGTTSTAPKSPSAGLTAGESTLATVKQGTVSGAAIGAVLTAGQLAINGKLNAHNLGEVAKGAGVSAAASAVGSKGEQLIAPVVDRAIGATVQKGVSNLATTVASEGVADTAGVAARTLATRAAGGTIVGAGIAAGISAWDNRAGLAHGDSKAIGNVAADTTVAAGSIAASVAVGAAVGSVVPVAGTAVGAVVGLAVGVGVTYGAQISGARDAIANGVAHGVDGIKDAAKSIGHFFGF